MDFLPWRQRKPSPMSPVKAPQVVPAVDLGKVLKMEEAELLAYLNSLQQTPETVTLCYLYALQRVQSKAEGNAMVQLTAQIEWLTRVLAALTAVGTGFAAIIVILAESDAINQGRSGVALLAVIGGLALAVAMGWEARRDGPDALHKDGGEKSKGSGVA